MTIGAAPSPLWPKSATAVPRVISVTTPPEDPRRTTRREGPHRTSSSDQISSVGSDQVSQGRVWLRVGQLRSDQHSSAQASSAPVSPAQVGSAKVRSAQVRPAWDGPDQVSIAGSFPTYVGKKKNDPHGGSSRMNFSPFMFTEHEWEFFDNLGV